MNDTELAERVAVTLRAKAAEVTTPRHGFNHADRGVAPFSEPTVGTPGGSGGRSGWRALAAAAAVLAVVIAGGVIIRASDGGSADTETDAAAPQPDDAVGDSVSSGTPDGVLAPGWVPDDLQLWEVQWSWGSPPPGSQDKAQLFMGPGDEARIFLTIDEPPGPTSGNNQVEVRGQQGEWGAGERADALFWDEGDAALAAFSKGMSQEDVIAFLESLSWRSEDPQEGFEPPEGSALSLAGETSGASRDGDLLNARYVYGYGEPTVSLQNDQLTIMTTVPVGDATGTVSRDHLNAWFGGSRDEDGTMTESDFYPDWASLDVMGPDGSQVRISARYDGVDESNVQRIADGISPISGGELDDLRRSVSDLYAGMPIVASAELPSATLSVRGRDAVRAFCIEVGETDAWCSAQAPTVGSGTDRRLASLRVGEDWYVAAMSPEEPPLITEGAVSGEALNEAMANNPDLDPEAIAGELAESQGGTPEELEIDSETAVDGEWHFALAIPSVDIDDVTVWFGTMYGTLSRSDSPLR